MYWERDQEINLLWTVLEPLDPDEDRGTADQIVCGLIDMGLVDADRAPCAQQAWCDQWEGRDVDHDFIAKWYVTEEEFSEMDD